VTRFLVSGLLTFGLLALAVDWLLAGYWPVGLLLLALTPLGLFLVKRKFIPTLSLFLALTVLLAAFGLWRKLELSLALFSVFCALAAWDLDGFSRRLALASAADQPALLERRHLLGISLVLLVAVGVSYLPFLLRFESNFEWAILLVVLTFGGIGALVHWLRNRES